MIEWKKIAYDLRDHIACIQAQLAAAEASVKELEANARLIAAAPDLLKALMAIVPDEDDDGWWCPECQAHIACVTNDESCTVCGTYLADVQPSEEWLKNARSAIAAASYTRKGARHDQQSPKILD